MASLSFAMTSTDYSLPSPPPAIADHVQGNAVALLFLLMLNESELN